MKEFEKIINLIDQEWDEGYNNDFSKATDNRKSFKAKSNAIGSKRSKLSVSNSNFAINAQDKEFEELFGSTFLKISKETGAAAIVANKSTEKSQEKEFEELFSLPLEKISRKLEKSNKTTVAANKSQTRLCGPPEPASEFQHLAATVPRESIRANGYIVLCQEQKPPVSCIAETYGLFVVDPFSKIRIVGSSAALVAIGDHGRFQTLEESLHVRNSGKGDHVSLSAISRWFRTGYGNKVNAEFWTTGVLARKLPDLRKSSTGFDYRVWEIADLNHVEQSWTVFLFGSAVTANVLSSISVGSVVDLLTPTILEDIAEGRMKFSINNSSQVHRIGEAKDFGYCEFKNEDEDSCTTVVNTFDCPVCSHHVSPEFMDANKKKQNFRAKMKLPSSTSELKYYSESSEQNKRLAIADLGTLTPQPEGISTIGSKQLIQVKLQDPSNTLKRNPAVPGNHTCIPFRKKPNPLPMPEHLKKPSKINPINLDPLKTRHLTDKDRRTLEVLSGCCGDSAGLVSSNSKIMNSTFLNVLSNPNSGARHFLKFLDLKDGKSSEGNDSFKANSLDAHPEARLTMTQETFLNMQKALNYFKTNEIIATKNLQTSRRNEVKRKINETVKYKHCKVFETEAKLKMKRTVENEQLEITMNTNSAQAGLNDLLQKTDHFIKLDGMKTVENNLSIKSETSSTAVMCRRCKYVAFRRSAMCKDLGHEIQIVNAMKRFFKCKDCGKKFMSLDPLLSRPCTNCKKSNWEMLAMWSE